MYSTLCANIYYHVKTLEVGRMISTIKKLISKEQNRTFPRNEKISKLSFKGCIFRIYQFLSGGYL